MLKRIVYGPALGAALLLSACGEQAHTAPPATPAQTVASVAMGTGQTTAQGATATGRPTPAGRRTAAHGATARRGRPVAIAPPARDDLRSRKGPVAKQPTWSYQVRLPAHSTRHQRLSHASLVTLNLKGNRVCWRFGSTPKVYVASAAFGRVHTAMTPTRAS